MTVFYTSPTTAPTQDPWHYNLGPAVLVEYLETSPRA
jgi:hypothetical protein